MNRYRYYIFSSILAIYFFGSCGITSKQSQLASINKIDTIEGFFFYEFDVPIKCYNRFDQIEQGNNLIYFDSLLSEQNIKNFYKKGVFVYQYQPFIHKFIEDKKVGISQNKQSINQFNKAINYNFQINDSSYLKTLYKDEKKIISYKKLYAKFLCLNLGELQQLVPKTKNYQCCYSNIDENLNTFFVIDVLDFELLN